MCEEDLVVQCATVLLMLAFLVSVMKMVFIRKTSAFRRGGRHRRHSGNGDVDEEFMRFY